MKKFLSLVLALVMAMSLVTVSAGAKDFNDSDKISDIAYEEAVNVMSEMGIIDGYGDGNFQPQGTLTRGAAAKIIACMMLGKTTAEALGTQAAPFKDVPVGSTFAGYIAYCSESGIIDGYSDGTFRPGNTLTGFAFLKMLLTALGYDSAIEGYANNANWTVNVAGRAKQIGLLDGNDNFVGTRAATREEACLYAVNALQATLVEYNDKGGSISVGDITINTGASNATYVTSNVYDAATSIDDTWDNTTHDYTVEFAEKYQPDLRLDREVDAFGRPSHTWTWKRVEIGSYIDQDKLVTEYTTKVTGRDLYDLLGSYVVDNDEFVVTIDGVDDVRVNNAVFGPNNIIKSNTKAVGATGNGVLTQVFRDSADGVTYIAIINTYLAEATDDFDEDNDVLDVDVYGYSEARRVKDTSIDANDDCVISGMEADNEDVPVADYEDGDIMLVRIADGEILEVMDPEVLADSTVTAFSLTKDTVTTGGTTYDKADTRLYDLGVLDDIDDYTGTPTLKGMTYNILLDPYGYVIGIERNEDPDQYVFITGYEEYSKNLSSAKAEAGAIFVDGTMETIEVDVDEALTDNAHAYDEYNWDPRGDAVLNRWYTYTVDKNGVYSLENIYVADADDPFDEIEALADGDISDVSDDVAQFAWSYTDKDKDIDKSHISLPAWSDTQGQTQGTVDAPTNVGKVVYGNAESVYLTVGTKDINNATVHGNATIISKVKSVTTGVKNANLTVDAVAALNRTTESGGVYTLYNDKGYVIASVVVGEDAAASSNYVFVTSDNASLEEDLGEDADSRWTREVLVNGELKDLVYVGDEIDCIDKGSMRQGLVYKVSYDADGFVIDSEQVTVYDAVYGPSIYARFDNSGDQVIDDIEDAEGNDDAVLLIVDLSVGNNELNTDKWTLFTTQDQTHGISLADDAKAVLIENVDDDMFDEVTIFDSKSENVKAAIKALYADESLNVDHNDPFNGAVYAIMEDGMATSVIIVDNVSRPGDFDGGTIIPGDNVITNGDATLVVTNNTSAAIFDAKNVRISNSGVISYEFNVGAANVGKEITFNINVTVDGVRVERQVAVTDTVAADGSVSGSVDIGGNYDKGSDVVLGITVTDLETPAVADPEMTYQVEYALESGVVISNEAAVTVKKSAVGDSFVVTGTAPAGYVFVGSDERTVTFQAGTNVTVTFVVEKEAVEETATVIKVVADGATVSIGGVVKGNDGVYDNNYAKGDVVEFTVANDGVVDPDAAVVTFNGEPVTLKSNKASVTLVEGENVLNVSISPKEYTVDFDWDTSNGSNWKAVASVTGVKNEVVEITLTRVAPMAFDWSQYKVTANGSALTAVDGTAVNGVAAVADSYEDASVSDADGFATAKAEHGTLYIKSGSEYYEAANYMGSNTYYYLVEGTEGTAPSITVQYKITSAGTVTLKVSK